MNLVGICPAEKAKSWKLKYPLYTHEEGFKPYNLLGGKPSTIIDASSYIEYLAGRRNGAVESAVKAYPDATHFLMVDPYFLEQTPQLERLVEDYQLAEQGGFILGGAIWGKVRTRVSHIFFNKMRWYDSWAVPEARFMPFGWNPANDHIAFRMKVPLKGFYRVCSVGGVYIFPRLVWDKGARYACPEDLHGCEHNYFCENSGTTSYVDFNTRFFRFKKYSVLKCVRCSAGTWRRRLSGNNTLEYPSEWQT